MRSRLISTAGAVALGSILCAPLAGAAPPAGRPLLVTVDDLPVAAGSLHAEPAERQRITRGLLAALERHRVPAVGFVVWGSVRGPADEALLAGWLAAGHELGNHTARHSDLSKASAAEWTADAEEGRAGLAGFLARHGRSGPRLFRFPYLREGDTEARLDAARAYLARSGQRAVPVTIDDQDWEYEAPWVAARRAGDVRGLERVADDYQRALRSEVALQTEQGDELFGRPTPQVLLLHANEVGSDQWDSLFRWLEGRGYRFASADEVLADPALAAPHRFVSPWGGSLWHRLAQSRRVEKAAAAVTTLLAEQAAAWSRGDLEAFCSVYADDALFVSPSGLTKGREAVLARYRKRYPDRAAMGSLTLEPLEVRPAWGPEVSDFGDALPGRVHVVRVAARWTLTRADGTSATGLTLIVLARQGGSFRIVEDASM